MEKLAHDFLKGRNIIYKNYPIPEQPLDKYTGIATAHEIYQYQKLIGSINYPTTMTRPDTAVAVSRLSEHLHNPSPYHYLLAIGVTMYLYITRYLAIQYTAI